LNVTSSRCARSASRPGHRHCSSWVLSDPRSASTSRVWPAV